MYFLILFMLACGYYTFTFGLSQLKKQNWSGGISTMAVAIIGTIAPSVVLFIKNL